jgi:hypothetical protein
MFQNWLFSIFVNKFPGICYLYVMKCNKINGMKSGIYHLSGHYLTHFLLTTKYGNFKTNVMSTKLVNVPFSFKANNVF